MQPPPATPDELTAAMLALAAKGDFEAMDRLAALYPADDADPEPAAEEE